MKVNEKKGLIMKSKQIMLVIVCALALLGCSREEKIPAQEKGNSQRLAEKSSVAMSSEDVLNDRLSKRGIEIGMNKVSGALVVVGTAAEENVVNAAMVTEAIRQRIFRSAFESALAEAALFINTQIVDTKKEGVVSQSTAIKTTEKGVVHFKEMAQGSLLGVNVFDFVEVFDDVSATYEISVAITWSEKSSRLATDVSEAKTIPSGKAGGLSLAGWIKSVESEMALLGGKWHIDDMGDRWIVGMVTKDGSMSSYLSQWVKDSKEARLFVGEEFGTSDKENYFLKMYALNWASRMLSDDVSVLREFGRAGESDDDFREEIEVNATFPLLQENDRVKWFERKFVNPLSQKEIEVLIAAVRCNDIAIGRKEYVDRRIAGSKK